MLLLILACYQAKITLDDTGKPDSDTTAGDTAPDSDSDGTGLLDDTSGDTDSGIKPDDTADDSGKDTSSDTSPDTADTDTGGDTAVEPTDPCLTEATDMVTRFESDVLALADSTDADLDGIPADADCDDADASVLGIEIERGDGTTIYLAALVDIGANVDDGSVIRICGIHSGEGIDLNMDGALDGASVYIGGDDATSGMSAIITGSTSSGLEVFGSVSLTVAQVTFYANSADTSSQSENSGRGGCIRAAEGSSLSLNSMSCVANTVPSGNHGAGLYVNDSIVIADGILVYGNTTPGEDSQGGGMDVEDASLVVLQDSWVVGNGDASRGDGLYLDGDTFGFTATNTCVGGNMPHDVKLGSSGDTYDYGYQTNLSCYSSGCTEF